MLKNIPDDIRAEHREKCNKCNLRKDYIQHFDMHFDWVDRPFVFDNDYEHYLKENGDDNKI